MNNDVSKLCNIIADINNKTKYLKEKYNSFYYRGVSFEDCYASDLEELRLLQDEFKYLLIKVI